MVVTRLRIASALLAICCWLPGAFAVQPSFYAGEVARQVGSVARPASGVEQVLHDGEFLLDTSVTAVPACRTQNGSAVAFDGTNFLAVWHDGRDGDGDADIYGARVSQSGTVLEPAGIPICRAAGDQWTPAVAFDGTNYLVVWANRRGDYDGLDICGARVTPSGVVLDTAEIPISTASGDQEHPALSFDGTNYLVAWADRRAGEMDVYGARVSPSGTVLDPQGIAICDTMRAQGYPAVSFDGTNCLVVWCDGRGQSWGIYGARVSPSGTVLDLQGLAICDSACRESRPAASFDGTNFLVVWTDMRDTGEYKSDIYGSRVTPSGTVLDPDGMPITTADGLQVSPAVSFDGTNYLVTWGSGGDICGSRVTPAGVVLDTSGIAISTAGGGDPALVFGGANYLVVWNDGRSPSGWSDVYGARVSTSGTVLEPEGIPVATEAHWQWLPAASFDGTDFLVVWEDYRNDADRSDIYGARVSQSGAVIDPPGFAISTAANSQSSPAVCFDGTNCLVVWTDSREDWNGDIYGARVSPAGAVLDSQGFAICTARGFQWSPAVAFDGTNFAVVWEDMRNGPGDIYGARVSPTGVVLDTGGIPISTAEREQFGACVSFDGANYLVVWGDNRVVTGTDIYGARLSPSGIVIDTAGIPISATSRWLWTPVLSFDGTNHMVVWAGSYNRFDTAYDIHGARVSPEGAVLDTSGITLSSVESPRPYPEVAFDGTNHLVAWERERGGSPCICGMRVTPQGTPFDSGTVVTGLHGSGGRDVNWPAFLALTRGTGDIMFLTYASRAGTVNDKAYNAQRIWGILNPAPGIEQEENVEVRRAIGGATVVRGVLFLPESANGGSRAASLLDIGGRKVLELRTGANDVRALAPGVYFVCEQPQAVSHKPQAVRKVVLTE